MSQIPLTHDNGHTHHVVETWHEGTEWYRVYSDGWIEQGGFINNSFASGYGQVTLNKPFSNTNYTIVMSYKTINASYGSSANSTFQGAYYITTSGFKYTGSSIDGIQRSWYACGY